LKIFFYSVTTKCDHYLFQYGVSANEVLPHKLVSAHAAVNCQSVVHNTSIIYLVAVIRSCRR